MVNLIFLILASIIMLANVLVSVYGFYSWVLKKNDIRSVIKLKRVGLLYIVLLIGLLIGYVFMTAAWTTCFNFDSQAEVIISQILFWCAIFASVSVCNILLVFKTVQYDKIYKMNDLQMTIDAYIDSIPGGVHHCIMNPNLAVSYVSDGFTNITGYTTKDMVEEFGGKYTKICYGDNDVNIFVDAIKHILKNMSSVSINYRIRHKNGNMVWVSENLKAVKDLQGIVHIFAVLTDISSEKFEADTDGLTDLLNKRAFVRVAAEYIQRNRNQQVGMFMVDIDFFKEINDKYGHANGDTALKMTAGILKDIFAEEDCLIARVGGDEFAVLIKNVVSEEKMCFLQKNLYQHLDFHITDFENDKTITCSVGYVYTDCSEGYDRIYHKADLAMYKEKELRHARRK